MEHLLQLFRTGFSGISLSCFNPYFYGTSTSTATTEYCGKASKKFQSLFLWNIYFNVSALKNIKFDFLSFNPYFYGTSTSTARKAVSLKN